MVPFVFKEIPTPGLIGLTILVSKVEGFIAKGLAQLLSSQCPS
jgi:hypothetical protein